MTTGSPAHWQDKLEATYRAIYQERMADMPLNNPAIDVHAIDFQESEHGILGVLVTPWCMNLMNLPHADDDWSDKPDLSKETLTFPSGLYTFTVGNEPAIGKYRMCSLFSPMFEFANDQAAVETAQAVMRELLNEENREQPDIDSQQIQDIWNGDISRDEVTAKQADPKEPERPTLSEKLERPVSRRDLLRGAFLKDEPPA